MALPAPLPRAAGPVDEAAGVETLLRSLRALHACADVLHAAAGALADKFDTALGLDR